MVRPAKVKDLVVEPRDVITPLRKVENLELKKVAKSTLCTLV